MIVDSRAGYRNERPQYVVRVNSESRLKMGQVICLYPLHKSDTIGIDYESPRLDKGT